MNFGFSVGDFVTLGQLAWKIYGSFKAAPESFQSLSRDLLSFNAVLKEAEQVIFARPLSLSQKHRLKFIHDGCYAVLKDLQKLVDRYEKGKRTWERFRWGLEDIAELRVRLIANTILLNTFIRHARPRYDCSSLS